MSLTYVTRGRFDEPISHLLRVPPALMQDIGDWVVQTILSRTERGLDVDGQPFEPLSDGYRKAKQDAGLSPQPDLTVSGRMLNDMRATVVQPGVVEIRFASRGGRSSGGTFIQRSRAVGAADKAFFHHEAGAGKSRVKRRFFDVSASEAAQIEAKVRAHFDRVL